VGKKKRLFAGSKARAAAPPRYKPCSPNAKLNGLEPLRWLTETLVDDHMAILSLHIDAHWHSAEYHETPLTTERTLASLPAFQQQQPGAAPANDP
jgi:cellulose synthase/poly-beta-1,6-N-acetylglucosamine synthase-like glycosyltransferase